MKIEKGKCEAMNTPLNTHIRSTSALRTRTLSDLLRFIRTHPMGMPIFVD